MAKRQTAVSPAETISAMRTDALLAYVEWPVFLHIRLKELDEALAITGESQPAPMSTAKADNPVGAPMRTEQPVLHPTPEPAPVVNFVPDLPAASQPDAVTDFLAQFPDGEGDAS